jgi:hypothetical protein
MKGWLAAQRVRLALGQPDAESDLDRIRYFHVTTSHRRTQRKAAHKEFLSMPHLRGYAEIGGVKVKVADGTYGGGVVGKSQTVNVYDSSDTEGHYKEVYRSRDRDKWVTAGQLERQISDLDSLDNFLIGRGFKKEGPRPKVPSGRPIA